MGARATSAEGVEERAEGEEAAEPAEPAARDADGPRRRWRGRFALTVPVGEEELGGVAGGHAGVSRRGGGWRDGTTKDGPDGRGREELWRGELELMEWT
jgi:hypothetical protein